ncbi:MAG: DUF721 domain-containing protein [Deltaproteobacteria bacterium]|nr:DUF721 domain-containing protein [Deltaproteobacteria bacterium]
MEGWRSQIGVAKTANKSLTMARKTLQQTDRIGAILGNSLKRLDLSSRLDEYGVWPIWNDVVGKTIALNAQPEKIRHGTLFIKVTSPVWMQQLQFMKEMIAEKLNHRLNAEIVKNIFFVVGRIDTGGLPPEEETAAASAPVLHNPKIDEQFLESVADPEIRQAFKRLLNSYLRRQRKQNNPHGR